MSTGDRAVLVTGATGQVGFSVLRALAAQNRPAIAISRGPRPGWTEGLAGVRWQQAELESGVPVGDLAQEPGVSGLIHAAPLEAAPAALAAAPGIRRIVALSSTSVLVKRSSSDPGERALMARLGAAEAALQAACEERGVAWTLLRPTLIYGCGLDANLTRVAGLVRKIPVFPLAHGGRGLRQPLHVADLAATALSALEVLEQPGTAGRTYVLAGGSTLSYRGMVAGVFRSLGRRPRFLSLPAPVLAALARVMGAGVSPAAVARMGDDLVFDDAPARAELGHAPRPFAPGPDAWRLPA